MVDPKYFGCYYDYYRKGTLYLGLLHLEDDAETIGSVKILKNLCVRDGWETDSCRLLEDNDWRGHLPPLVSYVASGRKVEVIEDALWRCVKKGSWVIPQLVAGLALAKSDVIGRAKQILNDGVHNKVDDPLLAHVQTGPGDDMSRLGKLMNSLHGLGYTDKLGLDNQSISELCKRDFDNANEIALEWYRELVDMLECT